MNFISPENLSEIIIIANKYNIELKSLQFIIEIQTFPIFKLNL